MNRLYRKEIKEFFSVLITNHVAKLEKPDDSEFGTVQYLGFFMREAMDCCVASVLIPCCFLVYFM